MLVYTRPNQKQIAIMTEISLFVVATAALLAVAAVAIDQLRFCVFMYMCMCICGSIVVGCVFIYALI